MTGLARQSDLVRQAASALQQVAESVGFDPQQHAIIIGVSGGPDSAALLHVLTRLLPTENLIVAHLDHGLRPTSAAEATRVADMAKDMRCHTSRVDVDHLARDRKLTLEEAGRIARYDFLASVAQQEGTPYIAVGHHADDQVETVLMHILRGSGLTGLRGMSPASVLPGHPGFWLLRPLLGTTRAEIENYCVENDLNPIHDKSNADKTFARNRLRHDLLPELERHNPQIRQRLLEMADIISGDDDLLNHLAGEAWLDVVDERGRGAIYMRRHVWNACPMALRRRLLRRAIVELNPTARDAGFRGLEAARLVAEKGITGTRAMLPGGLLLRVSYDWLIIAGEASDLASGFPQITADGSIKLPVPGVVELANGWRIEADHVDAIDEDTILATSDRWTVYITNMVIGELHIRARKKGERMRPLGMDGETSLKEIMIDRKIPAYLRERWPVIATPDQVVWLPGHILDSRARVLAGDDAVRLSCHHGVSGRVDVPPL